MTAYVDRVEQRTALVGNDEWPDDHYLITVWLSSSGSWVLTHRGADVASRRTYDGAVNDALRRLGVDPRDERVERTDERALGGVR